MFPFYIYTYIHTPDVKIVFCSACFVQKNKACHIFPYKKPPVFDYMVCAVAYVLLVTTCVFLCFRGIVDTEERRKRKALSAFQGRKAQAAACLLLALCARAGEGRRRVLAELYSALSCHPAEDGGGGVGVAGGGVSRGPVALAEGR